jgi:hypothetical protein
MSAAAEQPIVPPASSAKTNAANEVELTLADIEAGLASLPRAKVARGIALVGATLVVAMVGYRWYEGRDRTTLLVVGAALLLLLIVNRNPARKIARRVHDSLPEDARKIAVSVDDDGVHLCSGGAESLLPWSGIHKLVETRDVVVVFVSRENAQILPKRALNAVELIRLRELAKQKITAHEEPWLTPELTKRMLYWLLTFVVVWSVWFFFGRK